LPLVVSLYEGGAPTAVRPLRPPSVVRVSAALIANCEKLPRNAKRTAAGATRATRVAPAAAGLLLGHGLEGEVGGAGRPVAVEDAERRLLVAQGQVGQRGEVQVPDEHGRHPRIVGLHPLEGTHQVAGLVLRR